MRKFELCYKVNDNSYLFPQLLPVQEPDFSNYNDDTLILIVKYKFLPKSIFPRLMVKQHSNIIDSLHWRTGMIVSDNSIDATAVVRVDYSEKIIEFIVSGNRRQEYLTVLRTFLLNINRTFEALECTETIPLPDKRDVTVTYNHLLTLKDHGKTKCFPDGATHEYSIDDLLGVVRIANDEYIDKEKKLVSLLERVLEERDNKEDLITKAYDIIMLQPNVFGLGINVNAIVEKMINRNK